MLTDAELWAAAPGHAYGLIAITMVDLHAYLLLAWRSRLFLRLLGLWASIKLLLFLGDILTAPEFGITYIEFAEYLFGLPPYVASVVFQPVVIVLAMLASRLR
ncbi:MAG: hypothetical protein NZ920_01565 [Aigarchaeota archaeon]|nr:hypothetical protein [Aigarchaeota archaeon]MDW8093130.1 hypothetical protein [Nitrososphaerota archaeon]